VGLVDDRTHMPLWAGNLRCCSGRGRSIPLARGTSTPARGPLRAGNWRAVHWARGQDPRCPREEHTCAGAARHGHQELLQWVRKRNCPWDASGIDERESRK